MSSNINAVHQRKITIDICGGFTLENTPLDSHSFPLPQDREKIKERKEGKWII